MRFAVSVGAFVPNGAMELGATIGEWEASLGRAGCRLQSHWECRLPPGPFDRLLMNGARRRRRERADERKVDPANGRSGKDLARAKGKSPLASFVKKCLEEADDQ